MATEKPTLNSLVYQYLSNLNGKLAKQFKKECPGEVAQLPKDSPTIEVMVKHFTEDSKAGAKRKIVENGASNGVPSKKAKMNGHAKGGSEGSSDDSSSEEEEEPAKAKMNGKTNGTAKEESEDSSDDSSDEEEPAPKKTPAKAAPGNNKS